MKFHFFFRRAALVLGGALTLAALSSCVKDQGHPSNPGPHQGSGVTDGKDAMRSPGPHQGN